MILICMCVCVFLCNYHMNQGVPVHVPLQWKRPGKSATCITT